MGKRERKEREIYRAWKEREEREIESEREREREREKERDSKTVGQRQSPKINRRISRDLQMQI